MYLSLIHNSAELLNIAKIDHLAELLGIESFRLKEAALSPQYKTFFIPKKKGGIRTIDAPSPELKRIQRCLNCYLQATYNKIKPASVHGFIKRTDKDSPITGIVSNANNHVGRTKIMTIDIEDFFHSFSAIRVRDLFSGWPFYFPKPLANMVTMLTTWYDTLPMGAPTSPVVSNLLMYDLDLKLSVFAASKGGYYSRYVDDLTFSYGKWIDDASIEYIKSSIRNEGLIINPRKFRILSKDTRQTVTGLVVNERVNVDRRYIRKIRAILHDWEVNGLRSASARFFNTNNFNNSNDTEGFLKSINGRISFIGYVRGKNDRIYAALLERYRYLAMGND